MSAELNQDNFSRIGKLIMQHKGCDYYEAIRYLDSLRLRIVVNVEAIENRSYQSALITVLNAGKRVFKGGVTISMDGVVESKLPFSTEKNLKDMLMSYGAKFRGSDGENTSVISIGSAPPDLTECYQAAVSGWRGGVVPSISDVIIPEACDIDVPTAGVLAGGLAVGRAFVESIGLALIPAHQPLGLSLWNYSEDWLDPATDGPAIQYLPEKLWILGLGHLGQAFLWNLGMLPFPSQGSKFYLQDFDAVSEANLSAGLLCSEAEIGEMKTRVASRWLSECGIDSRLIERPFTHDLCVGEGEPIVALSGFDKTEPRALLESSGWELILDAGVGGAFENFDRMAINTFPQNGKTSRETFENQRVSNSSFKKELLDGLVDEQQCGMLVDQLSQTAVSTAYVGSCTGAVVVSEMLRQLHGQEKVDYFGAQIRSNELSPVIVESRKSVSQIYARNGIGRVDKCASIDFSHGRT